LLADYYPVLKTAKLVYNWYYAWCSDTSGSRLTYYDSAPRVALRGEWITHGITRCADRLIATQ